MDNGQTDPDISDIAGNRIKGTGYLWRGTYYYK